MRLRAILAAWRAHQARRQAEKLAAWQDLMAWMQAHGFQCRRCRRWHQFATQCR